MNIKIKRLHKDAIIPQYATPGAACFDLHSITINIIKPQESEIFFTGLAFEIPENHVMLVHSRSGHGFKNGIRLSNVTGVIDSDFRGEVKLKLHNDSLKIFLVEAGDRIAQAIILPYQQVRFDEVDLLSETERGLGGMGSTGR